MPVWHEKTRPLVEAGKLVLLGVIQEQHPDRCQLFAQWKQFDWPILHDPINLMGVGGVPIVTAIDEHGVVRSTRPRPDSFVAEFIDKSFDAPANDRLDRAVVPKLDELKRRFEQSQKPDDGLPYGDALVLWAGVDRLDEAIDVYRRVIEKAPENGDAHFRLGVCYRMRYDGENRRADDFQRAVDQWSRALDVDPNHYIRRRRIQQYGPRLDKPYSFYDWVRQAREDIRARGETPFPLVAEPGGAEFAYPGEFVASGGEATEPDPRGRIRRDAKDLIHVETTVVPPFVRPGQAARVHMTFRPNRTRKTHWNNEAEPLKVWIDPPKSWDVDQRLLTAAHPRETVTLEPRELNFEIRAPEGIDAADSRVSAYVLFYACEDVDGVCHYLRRDIQIPLRTADE